MLDLSAMERRIALQAFVRHRGKRIDVLLLLRRSPVQLLRRHVEERARRELSRDARHRLLYLSGNAEVENERMPIPPCPSCRTIR